MKAVQYEENKPGDDFTTVLQLKDVPMPEPSPGVAVVKVHAAAANPVDFKVLGGYLVDAGWSMDLPFTVGYDFSGTVHAVTNADAASWPVGMEVFAVQWGQHKHDEEGMPVGGTFAQYVSVPVKRLSVKPSAISHEQAAASALVGTTAHQIVNRCANVQSSQKVLILGGATSVGMIAVQLASQKGAKVYTTASARNKEFVSKLGKDVTIIDYRSVNWWEYAPFVMARDLDAVLDTTGEEGGWDHARLILKETGSFVSIASMDAGFDPSAHSPRNFAAFFCLANDPKAQDEIAAGLAEGKLKIPVVQQKFPFTEQGAKDILAAQAKGAHTGKLVMSID